MSIKSGNSQKYKGEQVKEHPFWRGGGKRVSVDRVTVYLCCVSCHLCVRTHHRNREACAHTSTITLLSAGHKHSCIHVSKPPTSLFFSDFHTFWLHFALGHMHTYCFQSTVCVQTSVNLISEKLKLNIYHVFKIHCS